MTTLEQGGERFESFGQQVHLDGFMSGGAKSLELTLKNISSVIPEYKARAYSPIEILMILDQEKPIAGICFGQCFPFWKKFEVTSLVNLRPEELIITDLSMTKLENNLTRDLPGILVPSGSEVIITRKNENYYQYNFSPTANFTAYS